MASTQAIFDGLQVNAMSSEFKTGDDVGVRMFADLALAHACTDSRPEKGNDKKHYDAATEIALAPKRGTGDVAFRACDGDEEGVGKEGVVDARAASLAAHLLTEARLPIRGRIFDHLDPFVNDDLGALFLYGICRSITGP